MIFFKVHLSSCLFCYFICLTTASKSFQLVKRAITPYQPPNPNGQSPVPNPNQQTPVNQAIRIGEPVDRPPELPQTHPIQHHDPPPRYERPSLWQRIRGYSGNQVNIDKKKGKGKLNEKEEEQERSKPGKMKQPGAGKHDHEAGTSGTKPPEEKKKGFWSKVLESDRRRSRYRYRTKAERERDAKAGEALFGITGAGVYGAYKGVEAVAKGVYNAGAAVGKRVKSGCNAACKAARDHTTRLRDRILGRQTEPNRMNRQFRDHQTRDHLDLNREPSSSYNSYRRLHRFPSSSSDSSQYLHRWNHGYDNRSPSPQHQPNQAAAPAPFHAPQHSLSTHSASSWGATVTDENSVNQYSGNDRGIIRARQHSQSSSHPSHTSSGNTPSVNRGSISHSPSISSRRTPDSSVVSRGSHSSQHRHPGQ